MNIHRRATAYAAEHQVPLAEAYRILGQHGARKRQAKRRREEAKQAGLENVRLPYVDR